MAQRARPRDPAPLLASSSAATAAPTAASPCDGPNDGAGTGVDVGIGFDESAGRVALGQEETAGVPDVAGQFLADGTLLKPVVVDTTVEDGREPAPVATRSAPATP